MEADERALFADQATLWRWRHGRPVRLKTDNRADRSALWRAACHCGWRGEWRKRLDTANREMRRHQGTHSKAEGQTYTEGHPKTAEFRDYMPPAKASTWSDADTALFSSGDLVTLVHVPGLEWIHAVPLPAHGRIVGSAGNIASWPAYYVRLNATGDQVQVRSTRIRRRSIIDAIGDLLEPEPGRTMT